MERAGKQEKMWSKISLNQIKEEKRGVLKGTNTTETNAHIPRRLGEKKKDQTEPPELPLENEANDEKRI